MFDDFNHNLVQKHIVLDFESYFNLFHGTFYFSHDVSFRKYLNELEEKEDHFVSDSRKLSEMSVLNIDELIKEFKLVPDEDYVCRSDAMYFTSYVFKLLLLRSKNTKYVKYYVILDQTIHYYQKYSKMNEENHGYFSWLFRKWF